MLLMKEKWEHCQKALKQNSMEAMISSYECNYCKECVETVLNRICPNCAGDFQPRPTRVSK